MKNNIPTSKPHYEILDGLRGVAAIVVLIFHISESFTLDPYLKFANHGYLAVDFFFVLSGFVIGYAYDGRWQKMSFGNFFKRRLIRLHPMVVFGMVLGAVLC
jgi:peptidoglycan/LPS O-acetylase OafA/YrhL